MHRTLLASALALLGLGTLPALAQQSFPATLEGQAVIPALTLVKAPADAPASLQVSGKYTNADRHRVDAIGSVMGMDGRRATGIAVPFNGQAVQGLSGIKTQSDGTFWTLSDNGFGSKLNSVDSALMLHHIKIDWAKNAVDRTETVFLSDPNNKVWFPIVHEGTKERYLTGADFDVESVQPVTDGFWIGDELGPFLIKVDRSGKVVAMFDTLVDGKAVRSPDHPAITLGANAAAKSPFFAVARSKGFEGLALSKDGSKLYGLLEGQIWKEDGSFEQVGGRPALRVLEFDVAKQAWTGRSWLYPFEVGGESIGDFNMIDATTALVIERDNGVGTSDKACAAGQPATNCFDNVAKLKRVYKIEMSDANVGQAVRKIGYIDLLNIRDPKNLAKQGTVEGVYGMPFVTIENVDVVDATHIIVGNDNNLPFSAGRNPNKADDNELVLLEVGAFLAAK